jgi:hypothetical protein
MLIDLEKRYLWKDAENALVKAEITVIKIWFRLMINHPSLLLVFV